MPDYTILLIDYDPKSIGKMRRSLTESGYRFELAKNGVEGIDQFKRLKPSMVLVEAMLPKKHGFEVCSEIKNSEQGADVPVVIITAVYRGRKYRSQAFHMYKCDEYLEKPLSDEKLLETVRRFLPGAPTAAAPPEPAKDEAPVTVERPASVKPAAPEPAADSPAAERSATAARKATEPSVPEKPVPSSQPAEPAATGSPSAAASKPAEPSAPQVSTSPPPAKNGNGANAPGSASVASSDEENMADFTEEDILSALDAIMPDEKPTKGAKSASG
jgi:DNA-binding response OmpR family regulator